MSIQTVLGTLRDQWRLIAAAALLGLACSFALTAMTPKKYTGRAQLFVSSEARSSASEMLSSSSFTQKRIASYVKLVSTPVVLQPVAESPQVELTLAELTSTTTASNPYGTVLIDVAVVAKTPAKSAELANAVARSFASAVTELEKTGTETSSPIKVSVVKPARVPSAPSSPSWTRNTLFGLLLGLSCGVGLALARKALDSRIHSDADVRDISDLPIVGAIHMDSQNVENELVSSTRPGSPRAEAYRHLRTNLGFVGAAENRRVFLFTSSVPGEGKTTTTTNLAFSLAQSGKTVCLVDADLRKPRVAQYLGLLNDVGLTNVLVGECEATSVMQQWSDSGLHVLAAGPTPPNPSELLGSERMERTLAELQNDFDIVIVDAAPLLPVTDSAILAAACGGAIVVVGCEKVRTHELARALEQLEGVSEGAAGIVVNLLPEKRSSRYGYGGTYGYGGYGDATHQSVEPRKEPTKTVLPKTAKLESSDMRITSK